MLKWTRRQYSPSEADISSKGPSLLFFCTLFLVLACGETEQIGDKLSDAELEFLRRQARIKCVSDTNSDYGDLISDANEAMLGYDRDEFVWDLKSTGSSTRTDKIYIWKRSATAVYFRIRTSEATPKHIYIKVTTTMNNDLLKSVQKDICDQDRYEGSANSSSATIKWIDEDFSREDEDTQFKFFRTWVFKANEPVLFGNLRFNQKKQLYNNDDDATTSSTDDFTITTGTRVDQDSDTYNDNTNYGTAASRYYCLLKSANADAGDTFRRYTITNIDLTNPDAASGNLECETNNDATTVTVGTESFSPATELTIP